MTDFSSLIDQLPIGDIAKQLGVSPDVATAAINAAVPAIVGGLEANSKTASGAQALESALVKHSQTDPSTVASNPDTADGKKIVSHVFGAKTGDVTAAVASKSNVAQELIAQVLPIIAPIVLSWVASQFFGGKAASSTAEAAPASSAAGGIGGLLGGLISSKEGQDLIGGALSGLLGGGTK
jgi:hypothetical protein